MPRHALPRAFDLARWSYCLDFVLMPPLTGLLLLLAFRLDLEVGWLFGLVAAGMVGWTFAEYWIHRALFHGPLAPMHDEHHRRPKDFIGIASWGTVASFAAAWLILAGALGAAMASATTAGLITGHLVYCSLHLAMHHFGARGFGRYGAMMRRLHDGHHRGGRGNFGVTSPLWDVVFGTFRP